MTDLASSCLCVNVVRTRKSYRVKVGNLDEECIKVIKVKLQYLYGTEERRMMQAGRYWWAMYSTWFRRPALITEWAVETRIVSRKRYGSLVDDVADKTPKSTKYCEDSAERQPQSTIRGLGRTSAEANTNSSPTYLQEWSVAVRLSRIEDARKTLNGLIISVLTVAFIVIARS